MKRQRSLVMVAAIVVVVVLGVLGSRVAPTAQAAPRRQEPICLNCFPSTPPTCIVVQGPDWAQCTIYFDTVEHRWCCLLQGACDG